MHAATLKLHIFKSQSYSTQFLSPPVQLARWAHMHRILSVVCPSVCLSLDQNSLDKNSYLMNISIRPRAMKFDSQGLQNVICVFVCKLLHSQNMLFGQYVIYDASRNKQVGSHQRQVAFFKARSKICVSRSIIFIIFYFIFSVLMSSFSLKFSNFL